MEYKLLKDINIMCPINGQTGYSIAAISIIDALTKLGVNVSLFPIGTEQCFAHLKYHASLQKSLQNTQFFKVDAPCLRIYHQFSMAEFVGRGTHVGFPFFELDKFSDLEKHHLSAPDTLFVSSQWASEVIEKEFNFPSKSIVPLGVDQEIFKPVPINKSKKTVFLHVGKWEQRKGHDLILECFNRAFRHDDNVELWMMSDNICKEDENIKWETRYKSSVLSNKIKFIHRVSSHDGVASIIAQSHFGLYPSRAEGWNLDLLETMSVGRTSIVSNYSAHTEFATDLNSILIQPDGLESAWDGIWFHNQGSWMLAGEPFKQSFADNMRLLYEKHQAGEDIYNYNGVETARNFSWGNTAKKICYYM